MYLRSHNVQFEPIDHWSGKERRRYKKSAFDTPWSKTLDLLDRELFKLGANNIVIQMDLGRHQIRQDGAPYAHSRTETPRVILSFKSKHGKLSYPCDRFDNWQDNIRAIALALESLRRVDRYGVTNTGEQYSGWAALPPPPVVANEFTSVEAAWGFLCQVAGIPATTPMNGFASTIIRKAQFKTHPDHGGDADRFKRVQAAADFLDQQKG